MQCFIPIISYILPFILPFSILFSVCTPPEGVSVASRNFYCKNSYYLCPSFRPHFRTKYYCFHCCNTFADSIIFFLTGLLFNILSFYNTLFKKFIASHLTFLTPLIRSCIWIQLPTSDRERTYHKLKLLIDKGYNMCTYLCFTDLFVSLFQSILVCQSPYFSSFFHCVYMPIELSFPSSCVCVCVCDVSTRVDVCFNLNVTFFVVLLLSPPGVFQLNMHSVVDTFIPLPVFCSLL